MGICTGRPQLMEPLPVIPVRLLSKRAYAEVWLMKQGEEYWVDKMYQMPNILMKSDLKNPRVRESPQDEAYFLKSLQPYSITVPLKQVWYGPVTDEMTTFHVATVFAEGGDLQTRCQEFRALTLVEWQQFMMESAQVILKLHQLGVAHLDISLENWVLFKQWRLIDFAVAQNKHVHRLKCYRDEKTGDPMLAKQRYLAPEVWSDETFNGFAADIFSWGVCSCASLLGYELFEKATTDDYHFELVTKHGWILFLKQMFQTTIHPLQKHPILPHMIELWSQMMCIQPTDRPSIEQIIDSPLFQACIRIHA